jgi:hypothetical protein
MLQELELTALETNIAVPITTRRLARKVQAQPGTTVWRDCVIASVACVLTITALSVCTVTWQRTQACMQNWPMAESEIGLGNHRQQKSGRDGGKSHPATETIEMEVPLTCQDQPSTAERSELLFQARATVINWERERERERERRRHMKGEGCIVT